jgi:pilus assembly protein FimV
MLARFKALHIGLILAGGLCTAQQALALRLGELTVESNLGEPLDATIEVLDVAGLDPSQISVSLGSEEDYAIAGAEFSPEATQVQFEVSVDGATGRIHLTTPGAVDEPFLDLLLNADWPDGSLQREFVVLLNLPGTATSSTDPLTIPSISDTDSPTADDAEFSRGDYGNGLSDDSQSYSVANGDSMWEIAARTRPGPDVSVQQMMLAIQRANEDAFINNNINRVLAGRVLRIPTLEEINLLDQAAAVTQINQQNQELGLQPLAVNRTPGNNNTVPLQDELTVLTDDQDSTTAAGDGGLEATLAALENEMMLSEESLDRARLENAELTSRFKMLEEEMDLLQNIIVVEDARIAQLQADLAEQATTTEQALATTEEAATALAVEQPAEQPGIAGKVTGWLQNTAIMMGVILGLLLVIRAICSGSAGA